MQKLEIIERISYLRCRANLSQKALSIAIGLNEGYINRLESKKDFLPSVEVLLRIMDACGSTTEEFFYYSIPQYAQDKEILDTLKNVKDEEKKAAVLTLLKR